MDRCPYCGAELEARLVAAIRNPSMEETCSKAPRAPKVKKRTADQTTVSEIRRLASLMLLGAQVRVAREEAGS